MARFTTIRDAYEHFQDLCGEYGSPRTMDDLRDQIHARGLRYEEITDETLWDDLFASGWPWSVERPLWQHTTSGEVYAVELTDGTVTAACGPLHDTERSIDPADYEYDVEDAEWLNEHAEEYRLYEPQ